jgi:hypothetical protein
MFYNKNCTDNVKQVVASALQIQFEALAEKYLWLPMVLGWSLKGAFKYMPKKIKALLWAAGQAMKLDVQGVRSY